MAVWKLWVCSAGDLAASIILVFQMFQSTSCRRNFDLSSSIPQPMLSANQCCVSFEVIPLSLSRAPGFDRTPDHLWLDRVRTARSRRRTDPLIPRRPHEHGLGRPDSNRQPSTVILLNAFGWGTRLVLLKRTFQNGPEQLGASTALRGEGDDPSPSEVLCRWSSTDDPSYQVALRLSSLVLLWSGR